MKAEKVVHRPYEQLKRALRADIDEAAWASLYSVPGAEHGSRSDKGGKPLRGEVLKVVEVR